MKTMKNRVVHRIGWRLGAALAAVLLSGCEPANNWPKRYPVSGKVLVDGKPAVRAVVAFHPTAPHSDGQSYLSTTFTDDDGAFQLTTFEAGDGAPPGDYRVTIVANWVSKNGLDSPVPDLLNGRYSDKTKSPLQVTVKEEPNALAPFDLKSR